MACEKKTLFKQIESGHSGIHFNNQITETDSMNPLNHINIYNGGGVGIGDFNNNGLQDIYFIGNMVPNKMYLNKGDLKFEDVTQAANVDGEGKLCRGVSVVDINNDNKLDIYVSATMSNDPQKRENLLYINQGNDNNGIPIFKELAAEYGLNDTTHTTMAHFFDFDNDGDLDVYLVVNEHLSTQNPNKFRPILADGSHPSTGRLYRNDWNASLNHGVFTDVSMQAGITIEGYGHGAIICDINEDGWKDIYVSNDFLSNNILYINNHDGTFTDRSKDYFKNTAVNSMGVDIQDINNDGLADVLELDMNPEDNFRKKMMMGSSSYQTYQNFDHYKYQYQYVRNTLQLNQGPRVMQNDSMGIPAFSQIGFLSGIAETDWSWAPLVADFDNDGYRDLIVTNGYPKDVTDHDFMVYRVNAAKIATWEDILRQVPQIKLPNYAFKNKGDLTFENKTNDWGLTTPTFSSGAAYADLDNDGDMDIIINNTNDEAFIYRNNSVENHKANAHFLNIKLSGDKQNVNGLGTWTHIYYDNGKHQVYEHTPYRGYLSSIQDMAHFGLGNVTVVDSVVVIWPDLKKQVLKNVPTDQMLYVNIMDANLTHSFTGSAIATHTLFREITDSVNIHYEHQEEDFIDFNIQRLLPHKFSEYSPALAVGDIDGDGLDDIVCGGSSSNSASLFFQQIDGTFIEKSLLSTKSSSLQRNQVSDRLASGSNNDYKDSGILLFDADGDGDLDLYISSGGYEYKPNTSAYQDRFYINDGKGNFTIDREALPQNFTSKFCVRAVDYDKDGDLDLFVAGRVEPWNYPKPVSSFIFRNDSNNGHVKFTDVTKSVAKDLIHIGLVCDAVFTDFDNDGWQDLIVVGEWMPITFLKNERGIYKNVSASSGINQRVGWWNTIAPGDFDNDGDIDYIVGNVGLNSFYKASEEYPVYITAKDFDMNGSYDAFPSLFLPSSNENPEKKEYPAHLRDDVNKQLVSMRRKFQNYNSYANATMDEIFTPEERKGALRLKTNTLESVYVRNDGEGKFTMTALPLEAQVSVLCGMVVEDFDGDGNLDVVINGNDYGADVSIGRFDALNGLFMKGDGKGNFIPQSILQSGIYIPGNGKSLAQLKSKSGKNLLAASQNKGLLKIFELKRRIRNIPLQPMDVSATVKYKNGKSQKREFYYGYSFLSQSGRFLNIDDQVVSVQIVDYKGSIRKISLD